MTEPVLPTFTATCHTEGCDNAGHPIALAYDPEFPPDAVMCGVCGQPITDTDAPRPREQTS